MGQIAFNAGIAKRLYNASYKFIGHIPGGMAMATVVGARIQGHLRIVPRHGGNVCERGRPRDGPV